MPVKTIKGPGAAEDQLVDNPKALELVVKRQDELRAFLIAIDDPNLPGMLDDDGLFATLLALAVNDYGVKQKDLASALNVSAAQVGRWASGEHAPRPYARPQVVQAIAHLVRHVLASTEARHKAA